MSLSRKFLAIFFITYNLAMAQLTPEQRLSRRPNFVQRIHSISTFS